MRIECALCCTLQSRYLTKVMNTEHLSSNPYDPPATLTQPVISKALKRSLLKNILLALLFSALLSVVFTILFTLVGRAIGLATFESNPNEYFESTYGIPIARGQHVTAYAVPFAVTGFLTGICLPWIWIFSLYLWSRRLRPGNTKR